MTILLTKCLAWADFALSDFSLIVRLSHANTLLYSVTAAIGVCPLAFRTQNGTGLALVCSGYS